MFFITRNKCFMEHRENKSYNCFKIDSSLNNKIFNFNNFSYCKKKTIIKHLVLVFYLIKSKRKSIKISAN